MKTNKEAVRDYQDKTTLIKVRVPSKDEGGIDYADIIRNRAKELGYINLKGKDKGAGSANAYILHLIAADCGLEELEPKKSATDGKDIAKK